VAVTPDGKIAFVANANLVLQPVPSGNSVSTIDVKTRTKHPTDITVGTNPIRVAVTPDGKTAFVTNSGSNTVSTIDVKTRTKDPTDIPVGTVGPPEGPFGSPTWVAVTPDGKTAYVVNSASNTVSTIDVKTRTKDPTDIPVGPHPTGVAVTPDGKIAFVANANLVLQPVPSGNSVSTIDVKTRTKNPTDIALGAVPFGVAVTPCRR
jgi:YVTN family beta-propeller protein